MKNYILPLLTLVLAVCLILAVQRCNHVQDMNVVNMNALTDTVKHFTNKLGMQTASIKTLQLDKKQMQDLLLDKDSDLKALASEFSKVHNVTKAEAEIVIQEVPILYRDTIPFNFERVDSVKTDWYKFRYVSNQKGLQIDSLRTWTSLTAITGTQRKWFLGKETVTTDVTFSNPYIKVTELKAAEITLPVPWYKKWYVWAAAGVIGGFVIAK